MSKQLSEWDLELWRLATRVYKKSRAIGATNGEAADDVIKALIREAGLQKNEAWQLSRAVLAWGMRDSIDQFWSIINRRADRR